jgi:hypothetical protein
LRAVKERLSFLRPWRKLKACDTALLGDFDDVLGERIMIAPATGSTVRNRRANSRPSTEGKMITPG